eukprot:scaffold80941_cov57-Phaeocystis_antarctica.AAC.2
MPSCKNTVPASPQHLAPGHLGTTSARARAQTRALSALARLSTPARQHEPAPASHQHTAHSAVAPPLIVRDLRPAPPTLMWQARRNTAGVRHHDERGSLASDGQALDQAPKRVGYHGALAPSYSHPGLTLNSSGSGSDLGQGPGLGPHPRHQLDLAALAAQEPEPGPSSTS